MLTPLSPSEGGVGGVTPLHAIPRIWSIAQEASIRPKPHLSFHLFEVEDSLASPLFSL